MRIITLNVNGIRAAAKKGLFDWLHEQKADVICLQETKAQTGQLPDPVFNPAGYCRYFADAEKRGYSGVGIYTRKEPDTVVTNLEKETGDSAWREFDHEGRYLEARFDGLSVVSLYAPSGSSSEHRQASKFRYLDLFMPWLKKIRRKRREYVLCGDWNIAHKKIDLKNWRSNQKHSGFLPEERAWMDELFGSVGFVDAFRSVDPRPDQYTWWSNRGEAWAKNVGWRIDYHVVTPALGDRVTSASIFKDRRFSDHAPLTMDYELE